MTGWQAGRIASHDNCNFMPYGQRIGESVKQSLAQVPCGLYRSCVANARPRVSWKIRAEFEIHAVGQISATFGLCPRQAPNEVQLPAGPIAADTTSFSLGRVQVL